MADFEIEVPINIKGTTKGSGKKVGEEIAEQMKKSLKSAGIGRTGGAGTTGGTSQAIKGFGKLLGIVAGILGVLGAMFFLLKPVLSLFNIILTLLLLPLIPILKPVLRLLGEFAKTLAPIMKKVAESVSQAFDAGGFEEAIATLFREMTSIVFPVVLDFFLTIFEGFTDALPAIIPSIIDAFVNVINALIDSGFMQRVIEAWTQVIIALIPLIPQMIPALVDLFIAIVEAILPFTPLLVNAFIEVILALIPFIPQIVGALIGAFITLIVELTKSLLRHVKNLALSAIGFGRKKRASGGPVSANTPFLVGERGAELFVPSASGNIVPNNQLSGSGVINITINKPTVRSESDLRAIANEVSRALQRQLGGRVSTGI